MIIQKVYRDLSCQDAANRAATEAKEKGLEVISIFAAPQITLFDGKDDAYVELRVEAQGANKKRT